MSEKLPNLWVVVCKEQPSQSCVVMPDAQGPLLGTDLYVPAERIRELRDNFHRMYMNQAPGHYKFGLGEIVSDLEALIEEEK